MKERDNSFAKIMLFISIFLAITLFLLAMPFHIVKAETSTQETNPKVEFRAEELKEVNGTNQLIVEVWLKDLDFRSIDIRIQYDTFLKTSNMSTNEIIVNDPLDENTPANFTFENGFDGYIDLWTYSDTEGILQLVYSLKFPEDITSSNEYLKTYTDGENYIEITDYVLLGKLSFKVEDGKITQDSIKLKTADTVPTTGIAITITETEGIEDESIFEFIVNLASTDAYLTNLILSSGEVNEENPEESTYKEYNLSPEFAKETFIYEVTLLEYVDKINIMVIQSDEKSTMKLKIPKRNENNELVYDIDGISIVYEEKEILNNVPIEFLLNKLGEPDTNVEVIVTAEDGETINKYTVVIKRPCGMIKGQIYTSPTASKGIYKSNIKLFKSEDVSTVIDWSRVEQGVTDDVHEKLLLLNYQDVQTNDDGTYEIYVVPGTYDILLDKTGYLDHIYTLKELSEGDIIDLGKKELIAGDINKDGVIEIMDVSAIMSVYGIDETNSKYDIKFDFNDDKQVEILDISIIMSSYAKSREIE